MKIIVLLSIILSMNFSILNAQEVNVELKCQPKGESKIILLMFVQVNGKDVLLITEESQDCKSSAHLGQPRSFMS